MSFRSSLQDEESKLEVNGGHSRVRKPADDLKISPASGRSQKVYQEAMSRLKSETHHVIRTLTLDVRMLKSKLKIKEEKITRLKDLVRELQVGCA
jgi:hypothetical protein